MSKFLDTTEALAVADSVNEALSDAGFSREEIIPGLIQAIVNLADGDDQLLDEAANLLADGGV